MCLVVWRPEKGCLPRSRVTEDYEPLCMCYELDTDLLEEQPMLFTESLQLQMSIFQEYLGYHNKKNGHLGETEKFLSQGLFFRTIVNGVSSVFMGKAMTDNPSRRLLLFSYRISWILKFLQIHYVAEDDLGPLILLLSAFFIGIPSVYHHVLMKSEKDQYFPHLAFRPKDIPPLLSKCLPIPPQSRLVIFPLYSSIFYSTPILVLVFLLC